MEMFIRRSGGDRGVRRGVSSGVATPEKLIANLGAVYDPTRGVVLSGSNFVTWADQVPGGTADTATARVGNEPTYVANDTGWPCVDFAGAQGFTINDSADLSPTSAFSISAWIKRASTGTSMAIFAKWVAPVFPFWFYIDAANNILLEMDAGANVGTYAFGATLAWQHVAVVYDGTLSGNANRLKMYQNGVQQALAFAGTIPATAADDAQQLSIGAQTAGAAPFQGRMGEVIFGKTAWTAADVAALYNYHRRN